MMKPKQVTSYLNPGKRSLQEDAIWFHEDKGIFLMIDGFGGPKAGLQSTELVQTEIKKFLIKEVGDEEATLPYIIKKYYSLASNVLYNSLIYANKRLLKNNREKNINEKGGATALVAYLDQSYLSVAQVGAGSLWLFRDKQFMPLMNPRSFEFSADPYRKEFSQARFSSIPLCALGMYEEFEPEIAEFLIQKNDVLLFLSDGFELKGLNSFLNRLNSNISTALSTDDEAACEALAQDFTKEASKLSFCDNASSLLVMF